MPPMQQAPRRSRSRSWSETSKRKSHQRSRSRPSVRSPTPPIVRSSSPTPSDSPFERPMTPPAATMRIRASTFPPIGPGSSSSSLGVNFHGGGGIPYLAAVGDWGNAQSDEFDSDAAHHGLNERSALSEALIRTPPALSSTNLARVGNFSSSSSIAHDMKQSPLGSPSMRPALQEVPGVPGHVLVEMAPGMQQTVNRNDRGSITYGTHAIAM
ncbi:hypothetical protein M407DRAFT_203787 [Tulasnella calospora MUT 4182]|uniref:Uncharacterized protein n=1 Tax=Tulasnella calospora MUT 4182 TaxID=1051891 RepID=A0A0C3Q104_9AGAM|nr:hypothetical protein M407DRAFT_203787 [Tulasnella calospora MUT 4182]